MLQLIIDVRNCINFDIHFLIGIITYFCPCYMFGKAAESVGDSCCLCGLVYFVGPVNLYARTHIRGKIREKKCIDVCDIGDLRLLVLREGGITSIKLLNSASSSRIFQCTYKFAMKR